MDYKKITEVSEYQKCSDSKWSNIITHLAKWSQKKTPKKLEVYLLDLGKLKYLLILTVFLFSSCGRASPPLEAEKSPTLFDLFSSDGSQLYTGYAVNQTNLDFYYLAGYRDAFENTEEKDKRVFILYQVNELSQSYFKGFKDGSARRKGK
jgi:hypothetical protein